MAAGLGFEPRYSPPKGDVLPLDDPAIDIQSKKRTGVRFHYAESFEKFNLACLRLPSLKDFFLKKFREWQRARLFVQPKNQILLVAYRENKCNQKAPQTLMHLAMLNRGNPPYPEIRRLHFSAAFF